MLAGLIQGLSSYLTAVQFVNRNRLWSYFFIPALVALLVAVVIFLLAISYADNLAELVQGIYPWETGKSIFNKVTNVFGGLLIGIVGLSAYKYLVLIIASPFMSLLSERVENEMVGVSEDVNWNLSRMLKELVRGIRINVRNFIREIFFTLLFFLMTIIPAIGFLSPIFIFLLQAYYAGFGNMDYTLERHLSTKASIRFVKRHRGFAIGNGIVFILLIASVVGILIVLPLSTVAAALGTVDSIHQESEAS